MLTEHEDTAQELRPPKGVPPTASHVIEVREPGRVPLRLVVSDSLPIGRAGAGLLLGDERLSRHHCVLRTDADGQLVIADAGSSNGTFVNDVRVSIAVPISAGDIVRIGDTTIFVDPRPATSPDGGLVEPLIRGTMLGFGLVPPPPQQASMVGGTVTLVFSDIVDSTAQNEALGDREWFKLLRQHDQLVREEVAANGGMQVKGQGDGFFLTFPSARRGLSFAVSTQRRMAELRASDPSYTLRVRIGIHTGEAIHDGGDLFGGHVNLAARIAGQAAADEIAVSSLVHEIAGPMGDFRFGPAREVTLRGFDGSHLIYPVQIGPES